MQRTDKPCRITPAGRALHNPVGRVDDRASDAHTVLDRLRPDDCLCVLGEGYMTKRDRQISEYAAESYEKGDEIRTNTTTNRDTTPAVGSVQRDLVERLRRWVVATDAVPASDLMDEAADEIARLRQFDRPQPIKPADDTRGEGAETVGQRLVERLSITQAMLDDNERLRAEIARLREAIRRLADQDATLSVQGGNVIVEMECQVLSQKNLTDEEREAVEWYANFPDGIHTDILRNLLERIGGER